MLRRLVIILFIELTALFITATYRWVDLQSTAVLVIFNALFISLFFKLKGPLPIKLALLAAGNLIGMAWNYCFHLLIVSAIDTGIVSNTSLSAFYTITYPFLNSIWVIAFWAVSLTALHRQNILRGKLSL